VCKVYGKIGDVNIFSFHWRFRDVLSGLEVIGDAAWSR
jgi:hypothetical protein